MKTIESSNSLFLIIFLLIIIGTPSAYIGTEYENFSNEILRESNTLSNRKADSLALIDFYYKKGGEQWNIQWDFERPMSSWFGVTLNSFGCVKCLDLDGDPNCNAKKKGGNGLKGTIVDLNLPFLEHLFLAGNQLSGKIPDFRYLPNLLTLQLSCNRFTGAIPNFGNLPRLNSLELDYNQLTGKIPGFQELKNLENLYLSNNELMDAIPDFDQLKNLKRLYLHKNQLRGSFPSLSSPKLERLILADNQLEGSIKSVVNLKKLTHLNLSNNNWNGTLEFLNLMPLLKSIVLAGNKFSGLIPDLQNLVYLVEIDLSNNQLTNAIPKFNSTSLRTILLSNNYFAGSRNQTELPALSTCSLSGNCLNFDDLMPYKKWLVKPEFYQPQSPATKDTLLEVSLGEEIVLKYDIHSNAKENIYKWYHNDKLIDSKKHHEKVIIESIIKENLGVYYCKITNPKFPSLELKSRQFIVDNIEDIEILSAPVLKNDFLNFDYAESNNYAFDVTENDTLIGTHHWDIQMISTPGIGMLTSFEDGTFELEVPPGFNGIIDFEYEICYLKQEDLCDVGIVEIQIKEPNTNDWNFLLPGNFSPNNGAHHETYVIPALLKEPEKFQYPQLIIYNRNGQAVFNQKPYKNNWKGTYQKSKIPLPMGIYYYQFIWENDGRHIKTGALMLIR